MALKTVDQIGKVEGAGESWDELVTKQINSLAKKYASDAAVTKVLAQWHHDITLGIRRNAKFSPHVNGFYMIFMIHGTWYEKYQRGTDPNNGSDPENGHAKQAPGISLEPTMKSTKNDSFNMLATDIDIPDVTEEYISVSSRIRNSFVPSRNYFVSDFSISYIDNVNLEVMRYHEAWHKYLELLKRGEVNMYDTEDECIKASTGEFLDMPFANAVWIVIFKPFTTDVQALIKLMGVMPVSFPLKQIVGNRSSTKMTVLNLQYKAADIFYKFYEDTKAMLSDDGELFKSFKKEVLDKN
jgi:hypothetical protein